MSRLPATEPAAAAMPATVPGAWRLAAAAIIGAVAVAGLWLGRDLLVPLALAALLAFVLDPLVTRLRRWRLPRGLAVTLVMACTVAVVGATTVFVGSQVVALGRSVPTYQDTMQQKLRSLREGLAGRGLLDQASRVLTLVERELDATRRALDHGEAPRAQAMRVVVEPAPTTPVQALRGLVAPVLQPALSAGLVLVFLVFMLLQRHDLRDRLLRLVGGDLHRSTDALDEAAQRVSRYLIAQLAVNFGYALPMALGLWLIGVPGALLWALLAGLLRFVPYLGAVIAAACPLAMAFAVDPGWAMLFETAALILVLELLVNNVVEPWVYGSRTGVAPVAVLVSAAFWTALWGPIGLILSTPMTVCLVVMGRHLPPLRFLDLLLGAEPAFDPPTRLYQRLLAGDVEEAIDLAATEVAATSLAAFYGDTAVPALRRAVADHAQVARAEHRHRVASGMATLLRDLREAQPAPTPAPASPRLLCVGGRWEVDNLGAEMLAHALAFDGEDAEARLAGDVGVEQIAALDLGHVRAVCLVYHSPSPEAHARSVCRRLRRRQPGLRIVLALWNAPPALLQPDAPASLGADAVATTVQEALRLLRGPGVPGSVPVDAGPHDEARRLQALAASGAREPALRPLFDRYARRVADIYDAPLAFVGFVERDHARWHGAAGLSEPEDAAGDARTVPRATSLCDLVVAQGETCVVEDSLRDPDFAQHPALLERGLRAFAAAPLRDAHGEVLGAVCVADRQPRRFSARERRLLEALAADLMHELASTAPGAPERSARDAPSGTAPDGPRGLAPATS